jgi:hypothetical protein
LTGLIWTSDQLVVKTSTYTGQHIKNTKKNNHASSGIRTHDASNKAAKTYVLHRAATGTESTEECRHLSGDVGGSTMDLSPNSTYSNGEKQQAVSLVVGTISTT